MLPETLLYPVTLLLLMGLFCWPKPRRLNKPFCNRRGY